VSFEGISDDLMIYGTLFSLSNRLQTHVDGMLPEITARQHFMLIVIFTLFKDTKPSLKDVANAMGCSYQNVKRMAENLEKSGFLLIERDAYDKRKYNLTLTNKIVTFSEKIEDESNKFMKDFYSDISEIYLKCTLNTLLKMEQNLKIIADAKGQRQ